MAMTMTQKILAAHAGLDKVEAGQLVLVNLDRVLGNDITSPVAIREFDKFGFSDVYDKDKVTMVMDHFAPNKDIKAAVQCKMCRDFCNEKEITHFYDVGRMGIEHALLPEKDLLLQATQLSAQTLTLAHTVRSAHFQRAWVQPIWLAVWQLVRHGSRFHLQSSLFLKESLTSIFQVRMLFFT